VAVVIGAGIFTLGAKVAATKAGPSVTIGFVLAAVACGLAAMCYAEFASTVPVAGSAYTFSYATLGEFVAWIIGWDLMLELALGAAVVSKGWSAYLGNLFDQFGGVLSTTFKIGSLTVDWGSIFIVVVLTALLVAGTKLSARTNLVITSIKVAVVLLVIVVGFFYFKASAFAAADPGQRTEQLRRVRHPVRRLGGVLRVHRLRRGGHRGGGDPQPEAGPAAGHLRLADHRHRAVRAGQHRGDGHGPVRPTRPAAARRNP
jgi:amino acid transporter